MSDASYSSKTAMRPAPLSASVFALALVVVPAISGAEVLQEMTVTAQKREQSIQDVGIAINAFSGEQIRTLGLENSVDIVRMVPGVSTGGSIAGQTQLFTIRGVTQNDFTDSVESPVAVYIDEGYISMGQGQTFGLFDLDRVEIEKGPQSTLFGRNATGGVIQYVTRKPTFDFGGYGDFTYGSYSQTKFEGALNGPLTSNIAARVAIMFNTHDEILKNRYTAADAPLSPGSGLPMTGSPGGGQNTWNDDTLGLRGQLLFRPVDKLEGLLSVSYARSHLSSAPYQSSGALPVVTDNNGNGFFEPWLGEQQVNTLKNPLNQNCEAISTTGACIGILGVNGKLRPTDVTFAPGFAGLADKLRAASPGGQYGDFFGYVDPDGKGLITKGDFAYNNLNRLETFGTSGKLVWDSSKALTVTGIADYKNFRKNVLMDVDAGPVPQSIFQTKANVDQMSFEVRANGELDRMRYVGGFYYLLINNHTVNGLAIPQNSPLMGDAIQTTSSPEFVPFAGVEADGLIDLKTNSYSLFGQLEYDFTDRLTLITGLRGMIESKDYRFESGGFANTDDTRIETAIKLFPLAVVDSVGLPSVISLYTDSHSETLWAGKVQLDYHLMDDVLLYAGVNRGVKAFSYNAQLQDGSPRLPSDKIRYNNEVLWSYEAGFKSTLFGGTTRFNGSIYYYDYKDYQAFLFTNSSGVVVNNDARTYGGEFDVTANPIRGLDVMLTFSAFNARVLDLQVAQGLSRNVQPTYAPELQISGLARYEWPFLGGRLALQGDFSIADSFYYNLRNFDSQRYAGHTVLNTRLTYLSADDKWEAAFFVENLTDARYGVMGFDLSTVCGCSEDYYGKPRWFGGNLRYKF